MPILRVWDFAISQNSICYALVDFHSQVIITVKQVFTPWCFNCEATSKQVEKLAKHYKGSSNLIFARIDASANEHPKLQVGVMKNCHLRFFFFFFIDKTHGHTESYWSLIRSKFMFTEGGFYLCLIFQVNDYPTLLLYRANDKTNPVITSWHHDFGDRILALYNYLSSITKPLFYADQTFYKF